MISKVRGATQKHHFVLSGLDGQNISLVFGDIEMFEQEFSPPFSSRTFSFRFHIICDLFGVTFSV